MLFHWPHEMILCPPKNFFYSHINLQSGAVIKKITPECCHNYKIQIFPGPQLWRQFCSPLQRLCPSTTLLLKPNEISFDCVCFPSTHLCFDFMISELLTHILMLQQRTLESPSALIHHWLHIVFVFLSILEAWKSSMC